MAKVQKEAYYLYDGFRKFVPNDQLSDYDKDFYKPKSYTVKFMTEHINKYVDVNYIHRIVKDKADIDLLNFFVHDFSQRYTKFNSAMRKYKNNNN